VVRIVSPKTTSITAIYHQFNYDPNATMTQVNVIVKTRSLITKFQVLREGKDLNIEALIFKLIDITVVLAIITAIVIIMIGEFCERILLRALLLDLFWV